MRYNDSGFQTHSNDTTYLTNMRRNLKLWLSLAPKGSVIFGTNQAAWQAYFADHLDRMRDANSTVRNLWIMVRAKSARIKDLTQAIDQQKRNGFVHELRANDWKAACESVVSQRDAREADLASIKEERNALTRAWNECNKIIDRRNTTVRDQADTLEARDSLIAALQVKLDEKEQAIEFWHDEFLVEAEAHDKLYATSKEQAEVFSAQSAQLDKLDDLLVKAYEGRDAAAARACDYARMIDNLRMDLSTQQATILQLQATQGNDLRTIQNHRANQIRQAKRIGQLEVDIELVKQAAYRESQEVDKLRARQRQAVSALADVNRDAWAATVAALAALEGRK